MDTKGKEEMPTNVGIEKVEFGTLGVPIIEEADLEEFIQSLEQEAVELAKAHEPPPILGQAHNGPALMQEMSESDPLYEIFRYMDEQLFEINSQFEKAERDRIQAKIEAERAETDRKIVAIKMDNAELEERFEERYRHLQALCNEIRAIANLKPKNSQWRDILHKVYYYTEGLPTYFERAKTKNFTTLSTEHTRYLVFTIETRTTAIEKLVNDHQNSVSEMRKEHLKKVIIEKTGKNPINYINNRAHSVKKGALSFKVSVGGLLAAISTFAKETLTLENFKNTKTAAKEGFASAWNSLKTTAGVILESAKTFIVDQYAAAKSWISDKWNSLTNRSSATVVAESEAIEMVEISPKTTVQAPDPLVESLRRVLKVEDSSSDASEYSYEEPDHTGEFLLLDGLRRHKTPQAELKVDFTPMAFEDYVDRISANDHEMIELSPSPIKD